MKVRDLMTKSVASCRPETNLAAAGALMWQSDCGILPVIDDRNRVIAVMTDRDACIALTTQDRRPSAMKVSDVVSGRPCVCDPGDDVLSALAVMRNKRVHRLPVVNRAGMLEGIVSLNDIVLRAEKVTSRRHPEITYDDIAVTLQAICSHKSGRRHAAAGGHAAEAA